MVWVILFKESLSFGAELASFMLYPFLSSESRYEGIFPYQRILLVILRDTTFFGFLALITDSLVTHERDILLFIIIIINIIIINIITVVIISIFFLFNRG